MAEAPARQRETMKRALAIPEVAKAIRKPMAPKHRLIAAAAEAAAIARGEAEPASVTHVTHAAVTHAEPSRAARWRKAHPEQHAAQQRAYRSRKKATT